MNNYTYGLFDMVTQKLCQIKCPSCFTSINMGESDLLEEQFKLPCGCEAKSKYLVGEVKQRIKGKLAK